MNKDILVTAIELTGPIKDIGAAATKALPPGRRYRYSRTARYILADGRTVETTVRGATKPKLAESIAFYERMIAAKSYSACFDDAGKFWGTSTRFGL